MTTSEKYLTATKTELDRAREKHPTAFRCPADGLAVILKQFQDAQGKALAGRPPHEIYREIVQMGAMCQRVVEDCRLAP